MKQLLASLLSLPLAVAAAGTNDLPALAPAYPELPPTFWQQHQTTLIVAGFTFLAVGLLFLKTMLRPESPTIPPPEAVARQALAKLQNEPEDGNVLSAASQILRRYISKTFKLPANEPTTAEFCAIIGTHPQIGAELAGAIAGFLHECDVRKFSLTYSATPIGAVQRALDFVARIEAQTHRQDASATTP